MSENWTVDGPRVIEVGGPDEVPQHVSVRLIGGRVDVVAHDDLDTITVEVTHTSGRPLEVTWEHGRLDVSHPKLVWDGMLDGLLSGKAFRSDGTAEVSIAVPRGVTVHLGTVSAEGLVSGTTAAAEVRTVSGTVVVDHVRGHVDARTVSGSIEVRHQDGPLSGNTVSGSLTVHAVAMQHLRAKTVSGALTVDLETAPSTLLTKTVSGDVVVRIPAHAGYEVTAKSVSGRVTAGDRQVSRRPGKVEGVLRDGEPDVKVVAQTVSGDVTLLRAPARPVAVVSTEKRL
jgi:hypothetical protein